VKHEKEPLIPFCFLLGLKTVMAKNKNINNLSVFSEVKTNPEDPVDPV